jgi:putative acetyltransferase
LGIRGFTWAWQVHCLLAHLFAPDLFAIFRPYVIFLSVIFLSFCFIPSRRRQVLIRHEQSGDAAAVFAVHAAAFPTDAEARLVDALRGAGQLSISLVAEDGGQVVGHVAFSPVTLASTTGGLGLAPLAVIPARQRQGIGGQLVREGLSAAATSGAKFVVVLGDPEYYRRFGFRRAGAVGLGNEYGADEEFMVLELQPGSLPPAGGLVKYAAAFAAFS